MLIPRLDRETASLPVATVLACTIDMETCLAQMAGTYLALGGDNAVYWDNDYSPVDIARELEQKMTALVREALAETFASFPAGALLCWEIHQLYSEAEWALGVWMTMESAFQFFLDVVGTVTDRRARKLLRYVLGLLMRHAPITPSHPAFLSWRFNDMLEDDLDYYEDKGDAGAVRDQLAELKEEEARFEKQFPDPVKGEITLRHINRVRRRMKKVQLDAEQERWLEQVIELLTMATDKEARRAMSEFFQSTQDDPEYEMTMSPETFLLAVWNEASTGAQLYYQDMDDCANSGYMPPLFKFTIRQKEDMDRMRVIARILALTGSIYFNGGDEWQSRT